jgi:hypothetical protein
VGKLETSTTTSQGKPRILAFRVTPYRRVHLEKLIVAEMRKILSRVCGTRRFITVFTESATKLYQEPDESGQNLPALFPYDPFQHYPIYAYVFKGILPSGLIT